MRDTASYTSTACMWNARIPFSLLILFVAASATARSVGAASCRPSTCALDAFALCDVSGELEGERRSHPDRQALGNNQLMSGVKADQGWRSAQGRARTMEDGAVVCLRGGDLPEFIDTVFDKIPANNSIVIILLASDVGLPYDLFTGEPMHFNRAEPSAWSTFWRKPPKEFNRMEARIANMVKFLNDSRLKHIYASNYDLVGCGPYSDSPVHPSEPAALKVSPFPLKCTPLCVPRESTGFFSRENKVLIGLPRMNAFKLGRSEVLAAAHALPVEEVTIPQIAKAWSSSAEIVKYHELLQKHKYVACPAGNGADTRRFWEALQHGTVPVVLSSPLDAIYERFPVAIVRQWSREELRVGNLNRLLREAGWFGDAPYNSDPFDHPLATQMFDLQWWNHSIRSGQPLFDPDGGLERTARRTAGVYPGCTPSPPASWVQLKECSKTRSGALARGDSMSCSGAIHNAFVHWRPAALPPGNSTKNRH